MKETSNKAIVSYISVLGSDEKEEEGVEVTLNLTPQHTTSLVSKTHRLFFVEVLFLDLPTRRKKSVKNGSYHGPVTPSRSSST